MKPIRSLLITGLALATCALTLHAEIFPVAEDTAGSPTAGITSKEGAQKTLAISSKSAAYLAFSVSGSGILATNVTGARLTIYLPKVKTAGNLSFHNIATAFSEATATTAPTLDPAFATASISSVDAKGFITIDVPVTLVNAWLTAPATEHGIAITSDDVNCTIATKEGTGVPAFIEVDTANAVNTDKLVDGSVTTPKLGDASVTTAKIASNTVTTATLVDASVTTAKIASNTVTTATLVDASVTAPKLDASIGVWTKSGANVFRSGGNVGIGTDEPGASLDIFKQTGAGNGEPSVRLSNDLDGDILTVRGRGRMVLNDYSSDSGLPAFTINENNGNAALVALGGNVGIGTDSPVGILEIVNPGETGGTPTLQVTSYDGNEIFQIFDQGRAVLNNYSDGGSSQAALTINENTGNVPALLALGGNVGIGTDSPATRLTVWTEPGEQYGIETTDGDIRLGTWLGEGVGQIGTISDHSLQFFVNNGGPVMTITNNENVGIGTETPAEKLDVNGNIRAAAGILLGSGTNTTENPNTPIILRRTISTDSSNGNVVAIGDDLSLQRDGTDAGLKVVYTGGVGSQQTVTAMGIDSTGANVNKVFTIPAGTTIGDTFTVYDGSEDVVYATISFGDPYNVSGLTTVVLQREPGDDYFHGTITSTANQ